MDIHFIHTKTINGLQAREKRVNLNQNKKDARSNCTEDHLSPPSHKVGQHCCEAGDNGQSCFADEAAR